MNKLHLALDWTPNINHIGFFIAQNKGFYSDLGIDLSITDPSSDNYQVTPAKKVELGEADFALCPTESVISYRTKPNPFGLKAIAAVLQEDLSAIVVREDSGIKNPKDLDRKSYASYQARYEDKIVQQMIKNDGGQGSIDIIYPEKLGIWETVLNKQHESTWVFMNWEGVQVKHLNEKLISFRLADYNIPYSYSPVIAADESLIHEKSDSYQQFLKATTEGYLYAQEHPESAVKILQPLVPDHEQNIDLSEALEATAASFTHEKQWGKMDESRVKHFLNWIQEHGLEEQVLSPNDIMTNELILEA